MFDMKRGQNRPADEAVDDELEQDRFGATPGAAPSRSSGGGAPSSAARVRDAAVIGPSIHIQGDLRGEEDLLIEGNVSGTIHLEENTLTIGANGKVKADVYAHSVFVDGSVEGDVYGSERVAIRKSGQVRGNVVSPRVSLEDGGRFKGMIEMDQQAVDSAFGHTAGRGRSQAGAATASSGAAASPSKETAPKEAASTGTSTTAASSTSSGTGSGTASSGSGSAGKSGSAGGS